MAALDFTDAAVMNTLTSELTGAVTATDTDSLLAESAGTHTTATVTVYRPYYVAALILRRALNTRRLKEARGARFDSPTVTIRGLLRQQAKYDANMLDEYADWVVPVGYEASSGAPVTF